MRQAVSVVWLLAASWAGAVPAQSPGQVFRDCSDCPEMVVVPSGSFVMGSPPGEVGRDPDEGPQGNVTIPRLYAAGRYEVTRGQFAAFVNETGYQSTGGNCRYS